MVYARIMRVKKKEGYLTTKVCFIRNNERGLSKYFYVPEYLQTLEEVKHEFPIACEESINTII